MRGSTLFAAFVTTLLFLSSCGGGEPASTPPSSSTSTPSAPSTTADTQEVFSVNCAACHGPSRQGVSGLGPALTPENLARLSDDEIRNTILKGRPNTAMAGFEKRLSAEEINALIQLIKHTSP